MPKRTIEPLVTERLTLRLLEERDLPATLAWRNRDDIRCWFLNPDKLVWENHLGWFRKYQERDDDFMFVIEENGNVQRPVGQIGLYRVDWEASQAEYGRLMIGEPTGAGRGLAQEATEALLGFAQISLKLRRVYLEVMNHNDRAIKLYQRCGFRQASETITSKIMEVTAA